MKKFFGIAIAMCLALSLVACSAAAQQRDNSQSSESRVQTVEDYSRELYTKLEELVKTVQPGTAGSSLKAIYAAKDLLSWAADNMPDRAEIETTVKYFFENSEYSAEVRQAFESISEVITTVTESETAQALLDTVGMAIEDFEAPQEVMDNINMLIAEINEYCGQ